jgi:aspartate/methionine/tyrosine aminotransferase
VFLNSPHNPTGKVINKEDIQFLNDLATEYPNLNFLSDEVYENIVFSYSSLPRLANYKNLFERTLNVYSGGKTYSCTGWRIGWAVGPEHLIDQLKDVQHCTNHAPSSLIQEALALAIPQGHQKYKGFTNFYEYLNQLFLRNVQILEAALKESDLGFNVITPEGGYFLTADISEAIGKMPVYYLFSEETREQKKHLKDTYLESISQYQTYQGN